MKFYIKKGDTVEVTAGEFKGSQGRVVSVLRDKYRAIVEGVNEVSRHTKPSAANPQGGITKKEAPIHISNLLVVNPSSKKGERVGYKKDADGKSVRYFKKSGEEV
ncbi:MAG: 50S ribosomal protein L24 [Flavobacteriales bacterium]|nr:50S ribosomal protein L24 [Flavobacteriales bacterium]